MTLENANSRRMAALERAMTLVLEAVDLLDAHGGPPEAAAHLDLGLQALRQAHSRLQGK
jgi:hypothetical protein